MLPSQVAELVEAEALDENRPPDVARYYALLSALDAIYQRDPQQWKPVFAGDKIQVSEGQSYLFAIETAEGWEYFSDCVVWDAETPPDWGSGSPGWQLSDEIFFAPLPQPPGVER